MTENDFLTELYLENEANKSSDGNSEEYLKNYVKMPTKAGTVRLRFLPPAAPGMFGRERNSFYMFTRTHKVNNKNLHCRLEKRIVGGKPRFEAPEEGEEGGCPICAYLRWLWPNSEDSPPDGKKRSALERANMKALYRQIKAVDRYYFNVIVRGEVDDEGKPVEPTPKILSVGKTLFTAISNKIAGDKQAQREGLGDVTDLKNGYDFFLVKKIKSGADGDYPEYAESDFDRKPSALSNNPDLVDKWLSGLHDLKSLRVVKSYKEMDQELKYHLGTEKKQVVQANFDPNKYRVDFSREITSSDEEDEVETKVSTKKSESKVETKVETKPVKVEADLMADSDWEQGLRNKVE